MYNDDYFLDASSPQTDEKIGWANFRVSHDGFVSRYEKLQTLKPLLLSKRVKLRVCTVGAKFRKIDTLNCNRCWYCMFNIAHLVSEGIDPRDCGFKIDGSTFKFMRFIIEERLLTKEEIKINWKILQQRIPEKIFFNIYGSEQFFEWFRKADLDSMGRTYRTPFFKIFFKLPYNLSISLKKIYELIRRGKSRDNNPFTTLYIS